MPRLNSIVLFLTFIFTTLLAPISYADKESRAPVAISTSQLKNFDSNSTKVKTLIKNALELANKKLHYKFGSADPRNNGLDCSGTINYLLKEQGMNSVPRQADELYQWTWEEGDFFAVNGHKSNSFELSELRPGDLLFWTGTYATRRDPAISHVMLYLGRDKEDHPLMFGATQGRTFKGKSRDGVGVYDFRVATSKTKARFLGYACIPNISCE